MLSTPAPAAIHLPPSLPMRLLRAGLLLLASVWVMLVLAWLAMFWFILPHINDWRGTLEAQATRALGMPVRLGAIQVRSSAWVPALHLAEVRLLDAQGRDALRLQGVDVALSPTSLLTLQPRLAQLHVQGADLDVRRDAAGHFHVGGHKLGTTDPAFTRRVLDAVFRQGEIVLRQGRVRWTDELRPQAGPLQLQDVQLVLRNTLRQHELRLDATPPPGWGQPFSLRGRFTQPLLARPGDLSRWQGQTYAEFPHAQLAALGSYLPLPFTLQEGEGALRVWTQWRSGLPREATADLALNAVRLQMAPTLAPLAAQQLRARVHLARHAQGLKFSSQGLSFRTFDGLHWPAGDLAFSLRQVQDLSALGASSEPVLGGEFSAGRLDLHLLARAAGRLPLAEPVRLALGQWAPKGLAEQLSFQWEGALHAPARYQLKARLTGLGWAAGGAGGAGLGRPGVSNARLDFQATEAGGSGQLSLAAGQLVLPGLWAEPALPLRQGQAQLQWRRLAPASGQPPGWELQVRDARFTTGDELQGQFQATWRRTAPGPGQLELQGSVAQAPATRVARYLPLALPEAVRSYVGQAITQGQLRDVQFRVRGPLQAFPFQGAEATQGELRIAAQVSEGGVDYLPTGPGQPPQHANHWPPVEAVQGEFVFEAGVLALRGASARLHGVAFDGIELRLDDLGHEPRLSLKGQGQGPAAQMLSYIEASPIGGWLDHTLAGVRVQGVAELALALDVPLRHPAQTQVKGELRLPGNSVQWRADLPTLESARALLKFTQSDLSLSDGQAQVLGGELRFTGRVQGSQARFSGEGRAPAQGLREQRLWPELAQAARLAEGEAAYQGELTLAAGAQQFTLRTDLQGVALALPAPLAKAAAEAWPSQLHLQWDTPEGGAPASRETVQLNLGSVLQAFAERDLSVAQPVLKRAGVGVLTAAPQAAAGLHVAVDLPQVNLEQWQAWQAMWAGKAAAAPAATPTPTLALWPESLALKVGELQAGARRLTHLAATLSPQRQANGQTLWRAAVQADQLAGQVEYRTAQGEQPGRLLARLARLSLPAAQGPALPQDLARSAARAAEHAPALDIEIDALEWQGRALGQLKVLAHHEAGAAPAWVLDRFSLAVPEARLRAQGRWLYGSARRPMQTDVALELDDSGRLLERLGVRQALTGGKGQINGRLNWAGSPLAPELGTLQGELKVALAQGQILKVDPGMARLLGVFSLQSLPRRLLGDFRDLTDDGFAFDRVDGDFALDAGVLHTHNLQMQGLQATALLQGEANLLRETQDLHVLVVPELNAGAASLAYAAVNPVVGLVSFAAQWLLRQPLMQANAQEFRITGGWGEPRVERIERTAPAAESGPVTPATSLSPASSPASTPSRNTP